MPGVEGEVSKKILDLTGTPWQPRSSDEALDIGEADADLTTTTATTEAPMPTTAEGDTIDSDRASREKETLLEQTTCDEVWAHEGMSRMLRPRATTQ
eukprot:4211780-Amphidinium_carterae.1